MERIFETYRPDCFHTVNAYIFADHPRELINFLQKAFFAIEINRTIDPTNNEITNCILKIGDSAFMIGRARGDFKNMRAAFYLFVNDVDFVYQNALEHGAIDCLSPTNMDYDDRQAGVQDSAGNYWWISKRLVEKDYAS